MEKELVVIQNSFELAQERCALQKHGDPLESLDEIEALAKYFYDQGRLRDACMYVLQCNTGLRIGDILDFTWGQCLYRDIDGQIRPHREAHKIENKTGKARVVRFNQATAAATYLHWLRSGQPTLDRYMFVSARAQGVNGKLTVRSASRIMTAAAKEANLWRPDRKISTHAIRKTGLNAVAGITKGAELDDNTIRRLQGVELAKLMGNHSDIKTTSKHYLSLQHQILNDRIDALNLGLNAIKEYCVKTTTPVTLAVRPMLTEVTK